MFGEVAMQSETFDLIQWLLDEGGPVIRYRTLVELAGYTASSDCEAALHAVLQTEKTQWLLDQLDRFGPLTRVDIGTLNALHGMRPTCLENIIPRLLERGLRAGVAVFDEKMERFRQYVDNPLVRQALDDPTHPTVEGGRAVLVATVLASYFMRGGYAYDEVMQFVLRRVVSISRLAAKKIYDIHLPEAQLAGLPKQWAGKPIINPDMDPMTGTTPLPFIHDLRAFAYMPAESLSAVTRRQLDDIAIYVTDERYRAFPPGYGYVCPGTSRRMCYACGWNLDLPDLDSAAPYNQRKIVQRLELLAHFPAAHQSAWFQEGMRLLETHRTERGTYAFPAAFLKEAKAGYYVGGEYMGLEDTRRTAKTLELESTFRMLLLKKLIA